MESPIVSWEMTNCMMLVGVRFFFFKYVVIGNCSLFSDWNVWNVITFPQLDTLIGSCRNLKTMQFIFKKIFLMTLLWVEFLFVRRWKLNVAMPKKYFKWKSFFNAHENFFNHMLANIWKKNFIIVWIISLTIKFQMYEKCFFIIKKKNSYKKETRNKCPR